MKINFTKNEYRLLLDIIYLGEWMLEAYETSPSPEHEGYKMVIQKIYSHAKEMGCEDLIDASKELGGYYPTSKYELDSGIHDHIDKYNSDNFWDELINRLTERDVKAESKAKNKEIESVEELWELSAPYEASYAEEFEKHGLSRLTIRETR